MILLLFYFFSQSEANGTVPLRSAGQLRRKKRVTRMVAIVILLFAWCWLPIQFFTLWYKFDPDFPLIPALLKFKIFAHTLSYANSCVNPFVYAFMNEGVRKAFQKKFPAASKYCQCLSKPKQANPETSTMIDKAVMTTRAGVDSMATTHCSLWCDWATLVDDVMSCDYTWFKWPVKRMLIWGFEI